MAWRGRLVKMAKDPTKIKSLIELDKAITSCKLCPRLVGWREEVAITKRKSYETEKYWGNQSRDLVLKTLRFLLLA